MLAPALMEEWAEPETFVHPLTSNSVKVYTLGIKFADDTFVLGDKEILQLPGWDRTARHFAYSEVSSDGWPYRMRDSYGASSHVVHDEAVLAHKVIFAMIFGYPLTLKAFCHFQTGEHDYYKVDHPTTLHITIDNITLMCSYAEYYACLPKVATIMLDLLFDHPTIWQSVADDPTRYLQLGTKLRSKHLYLEALRYLISRGPEDNYNTLAYALDVEPSEAETLFKPIVEQAHRRGERLMGSLLKLQLSKSSSYYAGVTSTAYTTFLNMLRFKSARRNQAQKMKEKAELLACSIFGQWLVQQLHGVRVYREGHRVRSRAIGSPAWAVQKLEEFSHYHDPVTLFGDHVAPRYSRIFNLGRQYSPDQMIHEELKLLIQQAKEEIDNALPVCSDFAHDGTVLTYRRTRYVRRFEEFTYLGLDEHDLPWKDDHRWEEPVDIPEAQLDVVTEEVLNALGMYVVDEHHEEGEDGEDGEDDEIDDGMGDRFRAVGDGTYTEEW